VTFTVQSLVNVLEEPSTDAELIKAMSSINSTGLESSHLSGLVTKCNGIRSLLSVCLDAVSGTVRSAALRTLAMVCCTSDSVRQFEKVINNPAGRGHTRARANVGRRRRPLFPTSNRRLLASDGNYRESILRS